ncbi:MAG: hypothetical protein AAB512_01760 [Patescibacteria group bacterium]|mgnify:CR=1 FL=1
MISFNDFNQIKSFKRLNKQATSKKLFAVTIIFIFACALFLRTYNYTHRIAFNADNSRDVIIGKFAAKNFLIPQIGQFSSAGPFFYGPWYYWYLVLISFIPGLLVPWFFSTLIDLLFIMLIFLLGKDAAGRKVGLLSAFFASISPAQVANSLTTWNVSVVPILVLTSLLFFVKFIKTRKEVYIFLLSFSVFLAWTVHFQNILIIPMLFIALLLVRPFSKFIICALLVTAGCLFALSPLIYFDYRFGWYNFRSILIYLLFDQNKLWVPNRWLTYVFDFWPNTWAIIIGGNKIVAMLIIFLSGLYTATRIVNFRKNIVYLYLILSFLVEIFLFKYYRGGRALYLSVFSYPMVFLITASTCVWLLGKNRYLGLILVLLITICTLFLTSNNVSAKAKDYLLARKIASEIIVEFPNRNIDLYSCSTDVNNINYPVALIMLNHSINYNAGENIGVCLGNWQVLNSAVRANTNITWYRQNAEDIYIDTVEWWKKDIPKPGNDFWKFLIKKIMSKFDPDYQ